MSVIVKGMEMPNGCPSCQFVMAYYCLLIGISDDNEVTNYINERHPKCPLVEIPTPHGRLVDVDDFMRHLISNVADLRKLSTGTVGKALHDTPTIIEAEGREE